MQTTSKKFLTASTLKKRYDISDITLDRWIKNEKLAFPRPMVVNRKRYFDEADIIEWERLNIRKVGARAGEVPA